MSDYAWILHDASGGILRVTESFSSKADAEAWIGSSWKELLDEGAETVSLSQDNQKLYEMGLRPR